MSTFIDLEKAHEHLLLKQENAKSNGQNVVQEALVYIRMVRFESKNVSDPEERERLRAYIRSWATYVRSQNVDYPDTDLLPPIKSRYAGIQSFINRFGSILLLSILMALFLIAAGVGSKNPIIHPDSFPWQLITLTILGIIVLILTVFIVVMRKQLIDVIKNNRGDKGVFQEVRKTLVGGGRRKVLAKLMVIEGPMSILGKELTIFTESVKLGRDPAQSDYSFFADTNSSVSGLHCRIERVNGTWRLVAVSKSGSETFLDGQSIPFNRPIPISNGQIIQMGYPAQQPVIFEFQAIDTGYQPQADDPRKTETDVIHTQVSNGHAPLSFGGPTDTPQEFGDDIFDQFRDRE